MMEKKPNPGSDEAIDAGCTCPVIDNEYGRGCGVGENGAVLFWTSGDCPIHGGKDGKA
jgi:hypothetical protein